MEQLDEEVVGGTGLIKKKYDYKKGVLYEGSPY